MVARLYILACLAVALVIGAGFQPLQLHRRAKFLYDPSTVLLCHFDGIDAATTFTDSAQATHTITAAGNAQLDTAQYEFSPSSLLLDGDGDYATITSAADLNCSGTSWTIEFWVRFVALPASGHSTCLVHKFVAYGLENRAWMIRLDNAYYGSNGLVFASWGAADVNPDYTPLCNIVEGAYSYSVDTWYHIAIIRDGSTITVCRDGAAIGSAGAISGDIRNSTCDAAIGQAAGGTDYISAHFDEFRISSVARYTTFPFTPPAAPFKP